jgi:hypothetical protein
MNVITAQTHIDKILTSENCICNIITLSRYIYEEDIVNNFPMIWTYTGNFNCTNDVKIRGVWFIALMFYLRNIRKNSHVIDTSQTVVVTKGRGEKLLSYYMALWLLKKDQSLFITNYTRFVKDIGYYKDCLNLAQMAKERNYTDTEIRILLMPMAVALMTDENVIILNHFNNSKETIKLSLASKWAPREGKAFSNLIPYLKQLCNITGSKSNMKWRKYIQTLVTYNIIDHSTAVVPSIETLLSTKKYDLINFNTIPIKARRLYKNTFMKIPKLCEKYINQVQIEKGIDPDVATPPMLDSNALKLTLVKQFIPLVNI